MNVYPGYLSNYSELFTMRILPSCKTATKDLVELSIFTTEGLTEDRARDLSTLKLNATQLGHGSIDNLVSLYHGSSANVGAVLSWFHYRLYYTDATVDRLQSILYLTNCWLIPDILTVKELLGVSFINIWTKTWVFCVVYFECLYIEKVLWKFPKILWEFDKNDNPMRVCQEAQEFELYTPLVKV